MIIIVTIPNTAFLHLFIFFITSFLYSNNYYSTSSSLVIRFYSGDYGADIYSGAYSTAITGI